MAEILETGYTLRGEKTATSSAALLSLVFKAEGGGRYYEEDLDKTKLVFACAREVIDEESAEVLAATTELLAEEAADILDYARAIASFEIDWVAFDEEYGINGRGDQ